jgi:hypothetical protein
MSKYGMVAAVCGGLLSVPCSGNAQGIQSCNLYPDSGCGSGVGWHVTVGGGNGGGLTHHEVCYKCINRHTMEQITPDHCHTCGFEQGGDDVGDDYALLMSAVEVGDREAVTTLAARLHSYVHINMDRSVLQVRSCERDLIVAQIPMATVQLVQVKTAIERVFDERRVSSVSDQSSESDR